MFSRSDTVSDKRIQCPVLDEGLPVSGGEVNAIRILPETGVAYFLDFIHYSAADQQAKVVCRVRVHEDTLVSIKERLSNDMVEVPCVKGPSVFWCAEKSGLVN